MNTADPSSSALFEKALAGLLESSAQQESSASQPERQVKRAVRNNIDPVSAAGDVLGDYRRYLKTLLSPKDPAIAAEFNRAIDTTQTFAKGPYLQLTPPYAPSRSIAELVEEGVLCASFKGMSKAFPVERPLYKHQENALRKIHSGRNLIVSTGTGSGKTESFLIPIIDSLLREKEKGTLRPGVRALLLYPMNALANDQLKRLREILKDTPEITFGRYTGETKQTFEQALSAYRETNGQKSEPLPNELISREQMQAEPPHILLTNYAMLEYLLLRPRDTTLFDGEFADDWKFIVIDEAHVYAGAQGTEVAMLLRRLKDRVARGKKLQCIATSASLEGSNQRITDFGSDIFGEPFEFDDSDETRQDIVRATILERPTTATWSFDDSLFDEEITEGGLLRSLEDRAPGAASETDLYELLCKEKHIVSLRELVKAHSTSLDDAAAYFWPELPTEHAMHRIHNLVLFGSSITSETGIPVFSARYHMFIRAAEGAFLGYEPDGAPRVFLDRRVTMPESDSLVYEMGACRKCGSIYLEGSVDGKVDKFLPLEETKRAPSGRGKHWFVHTSSDSEALADDDDGSAAADKQPSPLVYVCPSCGKISGKPTLTCGCGTHVPAVSGRLLRHSASDHMTCPECGASGNNLVRQLRTDSNAAPAVLTTSLFQLLPESEDDELADKIGAGRKLLAFSDSRQAAAFAAPYLEATYNRLMELRILFAALQHVDFSEAGEIDRWITKSAEIAAERRAIRRRLSNAERQEKVGPWVFSELASVRRKNALEGLGLVRVKLSRAYVDELDKVYGLIETLLGSRQASQDLIDLLVQNIRHNGALIAPSSVNYGDDRFSPRTGQQLFTKLGTSDSSPATKSWLPRRGTNTRFTFVQKVLQKLGAAGENDQNVTQLLDFVWQQLVEAQVLRQPIERREGFAVDYRALEVTNGDSCEWYECDVCRQLTAFNVLDLCPNGWCSGTLHRVDPKSEELFNDHYRSLARNMKIVPLSAKEHTAQWTPLEAAQIQKDFISGDVNVLSCSTTFELGVDVGDLQSVVLRNVPPRTANYVQRAGRAGRRTGSAAFVLTFARRDAHDFSIFQDPVSMIDGEMAAPFIQVGNPRIATRHMYSVAFAAFLRHLAESGTEWEDVGQFFLGKDDRPRGIPLIKEFLSSCPPEIHNALTRIFPTALHQELGISDDSWVAAYLDLFDLTNNALEDDYHIIEKERDFKISLQELRQAAAWDYTLHTIEKEKLLSLLAKRNLLPKYGFPVDTVELRTDFTEEGSKINLSRDLALAVSDYAPGASIVAGGKVWSTAGLQLRPGRSLRTFHWYECKECDNVETSISDFTEGSSCSQCGALIPLHKPKVMVIPEFGFVASPNPKQVGTIPPESSWHRLEFVRNFGDQQETSTFSNSGHEVIIRSYTRAEMGVLERGSTNNGFRVCPTCGWAGPSRSIPRTHKNPRTQKDCLGSVLLRSLGHFYQTDIAAIAVPSFFDAESEYWLSALYALIESASEHLEINRDDLTGTLAMSGGKRVLILSDAVPGGAGITQKIREYFPEVLEKAIHRVSDCSCGEDTSCYACLRSYSNRRFHTILRRDKALELLEEMSVAVGAQTNLGSS